MSNTTLGRSEAANETPKAAAVDMKFEIVVIPVSDVDRAKRFYGGLGWRLDADFASGDDWRAVQFTPPGSGCSMIFGKNVTAAAPGSAQGLYLIVSDIQTARQELLGRGVEVSEIFTMLATCMRARTSPSCLGGPGQRSGSPASQLPLLGLVQRSGRQRLAASGGHCAITRTRGHGRHDIHLLDRARGRTRRAAVAHGVPARLPADPLAHRQGTVDCTMDQLEMRSAR